VSLQGLAPLPKEFSEAGDVDKCDTVELALSEGILQNEKCPDNELLMLAQEACCV
jgi:hypothetical protein